MKRLILPLILFFPVVALIAWVIYGLDHNAAITHKATGTNSAATNLAPTAVAH